MEHCLLMHCLEKITGKETLKGRNRKSLEIIEVVPAPRIFTIHHCGRSEVACQKRDTALHQVADILSLVHYTGQIQEKPATGNGRRHGMQQLKAVLCAFISKKLLGQQPHSCDILCTSGHHLAAIYELEHIQERGFFCTTKVPI
jgi:hypothetical protein